MNLNDSESQNISKPPFFDGNNYSHWKAKMTIFIQSLYYNLWDLTVDGPDLPTTINENGEKVPKSRTRYNDEDRKKVQMNAKSKHIIICAINSNEFNRVSSCVSAKEMWDRLEITYECTNQVKEAKINMLIHEYEIDCPRLKKKEQIKKKKVMLATWDDSDESSSDEESPEKVGQLALMAIEKEEEENDEVIYDELILIVEKYSCIIYDLKKKKKILNVENNDLKKANNMLMLNNKDEKKIEILEKENECLKIEVDALKKTFSNIYNSSEKLEKLLGMQRCVFDKTGLGYDEMNNVKHYQKFFERKIKIEKEKVEKEIVRKKNTNVFL
ncbi:hypothetical protein CFOL_v3_23697 [Cephalotus follicularis]|uniref:DUF4219 domain-containing protein/UBN2 domain-containing protein n=1 Tax=Cephalotus follicularis TaxID=3775 RepID=A0A1Q3CJ02_CEPFO|nr:hypothetical protein CFOL_v3_23697 [Cephalotus follicularis]